MKKNSLVLEETLLCPINLAEIPPREGFKLYFDNYFTSVKLMKFLSNEGYCATGTIQEGRTEKCPLPPTKEMKKATRGSSDFCSSEEIMLVRWKDNNVVTIATNHEENKMGSCSRWSKEKKSTINVPQPEVFRSYNKGMGGVDLMDQMVATYRTRMRQKKWYWPIFSYFLDVSVVNAWLIMRKVLPNDDKTQSLLKFRRGISLSLLKNHGTPSRRGRQPNDPSIDCRFDGRNHWIISVPTEKKCRHCGGKAKFMCQKCEVGLHRKCFKNYHSY